MIRVAMAYTSVSTALNQNESVNVKAKLPTKALPSTATCFDVVNSPFNVIIFLRSKEMLQNINKIVKALATALIKFITNPIWLGSKANIEKNAPNIWNNGAPGGCPTCNLEEVSMYSPASQKLTVGSTVKL
jgi:hypothetical protein